MFQTTDEWIEYCQTVHPRGMDLGLTRITRVADQLNIRQFTVPVITVAGTNGKGSTVAFLSAFYLKNGYRVASYTSPHLLKFHERYQINGQSIQDDQLILAFEAIEQARLVCQVTLTYFEYAVLIAFYVFQQTPLDVIIIEVGLGGRLDATNIVDPTLSVITNIDFDHEAILGHTRDAIGYEKAGIFRPDRPAVFGDPRPVDSILQRAKQLDVPLWMIGRDFFLDVVEGDWNFSVDGFTLSNLPFPQLPLINAAIALMVVKLLEKQLPIEFERIASILPDVQLNGRWQHVKHPRCDIRLDVAHNPQSARYLADLCLKQRQSGRNFAVCSILADKDQIEMLRACRPVFSDWFIAPLHVTRGSQLPELLEQCHLAGLQSIHAHDSVQAALLAALAKAGKQDRIVCFGSFYTVAEALKTLADQGYN